MNSIERLTAAYRLEQTDRVPVASWIGLKLFHSMLPRYRTVFNLFDAIINDPVGTTIRVQENLGLDPIVIMQLEVPGGMVYYPRKLFSWADEANESWDVEESASESNLRRQIITTPEGQLSLTFRLGDYGCWPQEYLLKQEEDIELLKYRPDPSLLNINKVRRMVEKMIGRGLPYFVVPGVWNEACDLRGVTQLSMDLLERPEWVKRLLEIIKERIISLVKRLGKINEITIKYNQTWLGIGLSPDMFYEYVFEHDKEVIQTAHESGILVSYHNCGKGNKFLEGMADTGTDALETLTTPDQSGDIDLADAKKRIGDRVCLFGGFNEHVLKSDDPEVIRTEVKRCIDSAAEGGGYILRTAGQIFETKPMNIEIMTATAREYGKY